MKSSLWRKAGLIVLVALMASSLVSANTIQVVDNHVPKGSKEDPSEKGGLSVWVEIEDKVVLFDTGGETGQIVENIQEMGLDAARIDAVVVSHNQVDSVHGLAEVLAATEMKAKVYVPVPAGEAIWQQNSEAEVVEVAQPMVIAPDAWLVGPIIELDANAGTISVQALVLKSNDGLVVVVGCSDRGVVAVIKRVKEIFGEAKINLVAGAFHFRGSSRREIQEFSSKLQQLGVERLALSECTGGPALKNFRKEWGEQVVSFDLGDSIDF